MFCYLRYMYEEHVKCTNNNLTLENYSSEQPTIDTYIESCFVEPLKNSCLQARLRKIQQSDVCKRISSTCTEITVQLPQLHKVIELYTMMELTRSFDSLALATIYYNLGIIYKDCQGIKNVPLSLYNLSQSYKLLRRLKIDCNTIIIAVKTLIALSEIKETQRLLSKALKLCLRYVEQDNFQSKPIYTFLADATIDEDMRKSFRLLYESIIERMEILYSALGEMNYCIKTVHDLLNHRVRKLNSPNEACLWSDAAITLSTYFRNKLRFTETRNCLAAVEFILETLQSDPSYNAIRCTVKNLTAKVANAWLTYAIAILRESSSHLQAQERQIISSELREAAPQNLLLFTSISKHLECINNEITDSRVSLMDDANKITCFALEKYKVASITFCQLGKNGDYLNVLSKYVSVYKYLASFTSGTAQLVQIYTDRISFLRAIYKEYTPETHNATYFAAVLGMWKGAAQTLLPLIEGLEEYSDLCSTTRKDLEYIIPKLDYFKRSES